MSQVLEDLIGNMSIGELARLAGSTVSEVVAKVMGGAPTKAAPGLPSVASKAPRTAPPRKLPKGGLSVAAVLDILKSAKGPVSAQDVRAKVGGTPNQVRAALAKLAEAKQVKVTGERRGTRYTLR
jgi:hypothetical protein